MNNFFNIHEFFTWPYLTETVPVTLSYTNIVEFILIVCLILAATLLILAREKITETRPNRKLYRSIALYLILSDIYGFIVFFSRVQSLPFFSMRLLFFLWFVIMAVGLIWLIIHLILRHRKVLKNYHKEQLRLQYIPKRKNS